MNQVRKRKSAADRKAEIVETVIDLSGRMGPDRVTTQHLADAVGVTQPAIFRHFSTKAEIWDAVSERIVSDIEDTMPKEAASQDAIAGSVRGYVSLVEVLPAVPSILHSLELQTEHESLRQRFRTLDRNRHDKVTKFIEAGQKDDTFHPELPARDVATIILGWLKSLTLDWVLADRRFDMADEAERFIANLDGLIGRS